MVSPGEKTKKKKKRRTAKGSKDYYVREKTAKHKCGLCGSELHGTPHGKKKSQVAKMGKTKKRPSASFGGVLCGKCRRIAAEEKAKVESGVKQLEETDFKLRKMLGIKGETQ